jgi:hypothetical protein
MRNQRYPYQSHLATALRRIILLSLLPRRIHCFICNDRRSATGIGVRSTPWKSQQKCGLRPDPRYLPRLPPADHRMSLSGYAVTATTSCSKPAHEPHRAGLTGRPGPTLPTCDAFRSCRFGMPLTHCGSMTMGILRVAIMLHCGNFHFADVKLQLCFIFNTLTSRLRFGSHAAMHTRSPIVSVSSRPVALFHVAPQPRFPHLRRVARAGKSDFRLAQSKQRMAYA